MQYLASVLLINTQCDVSSRNFVAEIWASKMTVPTDPKLYCDDDQLKAQLEADSLRCQKIVDLSSPSSSASYRTVWNGFALVWKNWTSNRSLSQYNFGSAGTLIFNAHISAKEFLEPTSSCAFISNTLDKHCIDIAGCLRRVMAEFKLVETIIKKSRFFMVSSECQNKSPFTDTKQIKQQKKRAASKLQNDI